jgi:hypothetical protein
MTEHEAIANVGRGAALMDRQCPGWADKVPADGRLRMKDPRRCVWGWTHGRFAVGGAALCPAMLDALPPGESPLIYFGICAPAGSADQSRGHHLLADAWRAAIRARGGGLPRATEGSGCSS